MKQAHMNESNEKKECCDECGADKYKEIEILGIKRVVKIQCECEEKRDIEAMEQIKRNSKEILMSKRKKQSIRFWKCLSLYNFFAILCS